MKGLQIFHNIIAGRAPSAEIEDVFHVGGYVVGYQLKPELYGLDLAASKEGLKHKKADSHRDQGDGQGSADSNGSDFSFYGLDEIFYVHRESMIHSFEIVNIPRAGEQGLKTDWIKIYMNFVE